ncbi:MAG: putative toxin-antitoxin system toxin component, PIN family [Pseudomonadota bacterium]
MLKVVLDTNIFVSSLLSETGRPGTVIDAWRARQYLLVTSPPIISEIKRVIEAPSIRKKYGLTGDRIEKPILLLEKDAILVPGLSDAARAIPEDPTDEMFLSAALDAKADCIVSGDRHLLDLGEYQGIPVLTAHQFLQRLEKPPSSAL